MPQTKPKEGRFALSEPMYAFLDQVVLLGIPGVGTFYAAIATIWGLPYAEQVLQSLAALGVLLGVILKISKNSYKGSVKHVDGDLHIVVDEGGAELSNLEFDVLPDEMLEKEFVTLRVNTSK